MPSFSLSVIGGAALITDFFLSSNAVATLGGMVTDTLDGIARGTRTIQDNIMAPLRQIGGWMNTIRATLDLMRGGGGRSSDRRSRRYEEDY